MSASKTLLVLLVRLEKGSLIPVACQMLLANTGFTGCTLACGIPICPLGFSWYLVTCSKLRVPLKVGTCSHRIHGAAILYMVTWIPSIYHLYVSLHIAYIPAPWILWGWNHFHMLTDSAKSSGQVVPLKF